MATTGCLVFNGLTVVIKAWRSRGTKRQYRLLQIISHLLPGIRQTNGTESSFVKPERVSHDEG